MLRITKNEFENMNDESKSFGTDKINYITIPASLEIHPFLGDFSIFVGFNFQFLTSANLYSLLFLQDIENLEKGHSSDEYIISYKKKDKMKRDENSEIDGQKIYSRFGLKYEIGMRIPLLISLYFGFKFKDYLISHMKNEILKKNQKTTFYLQLILGVDINKLLSMF